MEVFVWRIMTNRILFVFRNINNLHPVTLLGDFKRFTRKFIVKQFRKI